MGVLGAERRAGMGTSPGALSWRMTHRIVELEVILKYSLLASISFPLTLPNDRLLGPMHRQELCYLLRELMQTVGKSFLGSKERLPLGDSPPWS